MNIYWILGFCTSTSLHSIEHQVSYSVDSSAFAVQDHACAAATEFLSELVKFYFMVACPSAHSCNASYYLVLMS
jgi:hypothetical protein